MNTDKKSFLSGTSGRRRRFRNVILSAVVLAAGAIGWSPVSAQQGHYLDRAPGTQHLAPAQRAYENGMYGVALRRFEKAAFWADKVAQFNLGVMHYHGQGVDADHARAWAWMSLAAEREYPHMVALADQVWAGLDEADQERAMGILESELLPDYGDEVAVARTSRHMTREQRKATGSRTGFAGNFLSVNEVKGPASFNKETQQLTFNSNHSVGTDFYQPELWDFEYIMAAEKWEFDAASRGHVLLHDIELEDLDDENRQDDD